MNNCDKIKYINEILEVGKQLKPYLEKHDIRIGCVDKSVQAKYEAQEMRRLMECTSMKR